MSTNELVVRRYLQAVWNEGDGEAIAGLVDERFRPGEELAVLFPPPYERPAGVRSRLAAVRDAFPDLQLAVDAVREQGDRVEVDWTITGTHLGLFLGYPPTGRRITVTGHSSFRLRGGKLVERHGRLSRLDLIRQLRPAE
jgi:steroid delta-isomerase-like uncharacterized protein